MRSEAIRGFGNRALAAGLLAGTALVSMHIAAPAVVHAQERAARPAGEAQQRRFNIRPQPLPGALTIFGQQSGLQVSVDAAAVRTLNSPGASGTMSAQAALDRLLSGTGLFYRFTSATTVIIAKPGSGAAGGPVDAGGSLVLDTITVQAAAENAWGPVDGYIATRSATATRTDTAIMETPQTINVVTRDQMAMQGAQQVKQAVRYSSGVQSDLHGDVSRFDQFSFRGFASVTDNNQFLDGLRLPRGTSYLIAQTDPWNLERIEILKGPASVLYGRAPLSGIVNTISKRPADQPFAEVDVLFGSHNRKQVGLDFGGPANQEGTLLYRLGVLGRDADTSVRLTEEQRILIAPSFTWRPDDATSFTFISSYQRDPKGGYYGFLPYNGTVVPTRYGRIPRDFFDGSPLENDFDRTQVAVGYAFAHRFSDNWAVHQNLRFLHMHLDQSLVYSIAMLPDNRTLARLSQWSRERMNALNVDTNLQGSFDTGAVSHKVTFGFDYQWDIWKQSFGYGAAPSLDFLNPNYGLPIPRAPVSSTPHRTQNIFGLYGQDQLKIGNLSVLLSGRYDWDEIDNRNALTGLSSDQDHGKFTYRVGTMYNFDNGLAPYATYATSFDPTVTANAYGTPFKPTTGEQFEVGIKYQPDGFPGLVTFSAFELTQQNVLTRDPTPGAPINRYVQTGEVRSRGIELEARLNPTEGLNLIGTFSWIDPEVTRSNGTDLGKRPVNTSRTLATSWADYTIRSGPLAGLTIGGGVRYVGSAFADTDNTLRVPPYVLADAVIRYDFGHLDAKLKGLTASVNMTNIFDRTYYACNAANACNYGEGRSVFGSLNYRW